MASWCALAGMAPAAHSKAVHAAFWRTFISPITSPGDRTRDTCALANHCRCPIPVDPLHNPEFVRPVPDELERISGAAAVDVAMRLHEDVLPNDRHQHRLIQQRPLCA